MSIGLIFECGPQGADKLVCEYLATHIRPGVKVSSRTLNNKKDLLQDAGKVAAQLLKDGCRCVLIIWDLRPAWPDRKDKLCRATECRQVLKTLEDAGVPVGAPVYPVCIEQELESWLLASHRAISAHLSTAAHVYSVKRVKSPDEYMQPKAVMLKHFRISRGWVYDDKVDAIRVLKAIDIDLGSLRRSVSFSRFEAKLLQCGT